MDFRKQNHKAPSVSAQRRICRDYLLLLPEDCMLQIAGEWYHCAGKQLRSYDSRWRLIFERLPGPSVPKGKTEPHIATRNLHTQQCRRASITAHSAQTQWDTMCSLYIASSQMRNLRELFKIAVWFCWPWNKNNIQAITTIKNDAQKWRLLFFLWPTTGFIQILHLGGQLVTLSTQEHGQCQWYFSASQLVPFSPRLSAYVLMITH